MKNLSKVSIAVLVIVIALVAGFLWFNKGKKIVVSKPVSTISVATTTLPVQVPVTPIVVTPVAPAPGLPDTGIAPIN